MARPLALAARLLYWLAVLVASVAVLVAVMLYLESRDESSVSGPHAGTPPAAPVGATGADRLRPFPASPGFPSAPSFAAPFRVAGR